MTSKFRILMAAAVLASAAVLPVAAEAQYRGGYGGGYRGGYHGGYHRGGIGPGGIIAGTLLGLGAAAVIGGVLAPAYVAPPPVYYAPPPPAYYPPPPAYYAPPPGYYVRPY